MPSKRRKKREAHGRPMRISEAHHRHAPHPPFYRSPTFPPLSLTLVDALEQTDKEAGDHDVTQAEDGKGILSRGRGGLKEKRRRGRR